MNTRWISVGLALLLLVAISLAIAFPPRVFYPTLSVETPTSTGGVTLAFHFQPRATLRDCEALTGNIVRVTLASCPQCQVRNLQCRDTPSDATRRALGESTLDVPAGQMHNGTLLFHSSDTALALAACRAAQAQSAGSPNPISCVGPGDTRKAPAPRPIGELWLLGLLAAALAASWLGGWFIIRYEHLHGTLTHDHAGTGPQKFHATPTPRVGGIGVMMGLLAAAAFMLVADALPREREFALLLLAGLPAFLGGLAEDVTKRIGVTERLLLTMLSGALAAWLLGAVLQRLDLPGMDSALAWLPFAVVFTSFAVGGVANSINIIDGYHGLAAGVVVIALTALAFVAHAAGDVLVLTAALSLGGALLGFLAWNWPRGRIFLGDGGAYLTGFLVAELAVLLVLRNPAVSPWFPLLLLVHPVFETLYSMQRRIFGHRLPPGQPDDAHLHQLIYKRLVSNSAETAKQHMNPRVAKYLWLPSALAAAMGSAFWQSSSILIFAAVVYGSAYVFVYKKLHEPQN